MRTWVYTYKTSDGLRHEGELGAPDKDSVYAALRERGIRAIKVTERIQPVVRKGFKGLRKRDVVCLVLCAVCLAGVVWFLAMREVQKNLPVNRTIDHSEQSNNRLVPLPRHQIAGFEDIDLATVFESESDIYLARYAQPGYVVPCALCLVPSAEVIEDLIANLKTPMTAGAGDEANVVELKRTVQGVKNEVALFLAGGRSINDILAWLDERQRMEAAHREKFAANVKRGVTKKESANQILRTMGLREVE